MENKSTEKNKIKKSDIIKVNYDNSESLPKIEKLNDKELDKKMDKIKKILDYNTKVLRTLNLEYKGSALVMKDQ